MPRASTAPPPSSSRGASASKKRSSRACELCRDKKTKCEPTSTGSCRRCISRNVTCSGIAADNVATAAANSLASAAQAEHEEKGSTSPADPAVVSRKRKASSAAHQEGVPGPSKRRKATPAARPGRQQEEDVGSTLPADPSAGPSGPQPASVTGTHGEAEAAPAVSAPTTRKRSRIASEDPRPLGKRIRLVLSGVGSSGPNAREESLAAASSSSNSGAPAMVPTAAAAAVAATGDADADVSSGPAVAPGAPGTAAPLAATPGNAAPAAVASVVGGRAVAGDGAAGADARPVEGSSVWPGPAQGRIPAAAASSPREGGRRRGLTPVPRPKVTPAFPSKLTGTGPVVSDAMLTEDELAMFAAAGIPLPEAAGGNQDGAAAQTGRRKKKARRPAKPKAKPIWHETLNEAYKLVSDQQPKNPLLALSRFFAQKAAEAGEVSDSER